MKGALEATTGATEATEAVTGWCAVKGAAEATTAAAGATEWWATEATTGWWAVKGRVECPTEWWATEAAVKGETEETKGAAEATEGAAWWMAQSENVVANSDHRMYKKATLRVIN